MDIVGLIPAGGIAKRLGRIPCSKEIFPVVRPDGEIGVTSSNLIGYFKTAGIINIYFIISRHKWDIPEYFGDGSQDNVNIGYLITNLPFGTPFTVDQAYPFVADKVIALGYPDILIYPEDAFAVLKSKFLESNADVFLGIVPSKDFLKSDMLEFDESGKIRNIVIKQNRPDLHYSWFGAIWRPSFTGFMHTWLADFIRNHPDGMFVSDQKHERELYVGDLFQAALSNQLKIEYHIFPEGRYVDLGTPGAIRNVSL